MKPAAIYLASQSPRRSALLTSMGIAFDLLLADASEDPEALEIALLREGARHYVMRVTALKAAAALVRCKDRKLAARPILAADTVVVLDRTILSKPVDAADARHMLEALSGRTHRVMTAVALTSQTKMSLALSVTSVTMRELHRGEIRDYIASAEPFGKAGAYAIQGRAGAWVSHLSGSYTGVMGLPLFETMALLKQYGVASA